MNVIELAGTAACVWISFIMVALLIKLVKGPRLTDRIVLVGLFNTMVISATSIWGVCMGRTYLLDVALIFALMSFFGVTILSGLIERHRREMSFKKDGAHNDD